MAGAVPGGGGGALPPVPVVGGQEFLLLPEPEGAVLNHGGPDAVQLEGARNNSEADKAKAVKVIAVQCVNVFLV